MKDKKNMNVHLRRFIGIATFIFAGAGFAHLCLIIQGTSVVIGNTTVPRELSYTVIFIAFCMVIMGGYYLINLKKN